MQLTPVLFSDAELAVLLQGKACTPIWLPVHHSCCPTRSGAASALFQWPMQYLLTL